MARHSFSSFTTVVSGAIVSATWLAVSVAAPPGHPGPCTVRCRVRSARRRAQGTLVTMDSNDALGGLEHDDKAKSPDIVIKEEGVYFMVAAIQVGKEKGDGGDDYIDVWMKQNAKDVDNSGCRQAIKDSKFTTVLVCQGIAECKAGDKFNVVISSNSVDHGVGIIKIAPKGEPAIPSIIFSIFKIK